MPSNFNISEFRYPSDFEFFPIFKFKKPRNPRNIKALINRTGGQCKQCPNGYDAIGTACRAPPGLHTSPSEKAARFFKTLIFQPVRFFQNRNFRESAFPVSVAFALVSFCQFQELSRHFFSQFRNFSSYSLQIYTPDKVLVFPQVPSQIPRSVS